MRKRSARAATSEGDGEGDNAPKRPRRETKRNVDKDSVYYQEHMELGM